MQAIDELVKQIANDPVVGMQTLANYINESSEADQKKEYNSRKVINTRFKDLIQKGRYIQADQETAKHIGAIQTPMAKFMSKFNGVGTKEEFNNNLAKFKEENKKVPASVLDFVTETMFVMDDYSRNKTGAAFTDQERAFYEDLLGANSNLSTVLQRLETAQKYQQALL